MGDILESTSSGGSDGTTVSVFRQLGHMKQFRAHLSRALSTFQDKTIGDDAPVLLCTDACTGNLEQAVRTIVAAHFHQYASIAPDRVALLAEEQVV